MRLENGRIYNFNYSNLSSSFDFTIFHKGLYEIANIIIPKPDKIKSFIIFILKC